ncbi:MAG: protease complex subunit PrcB family protein [Vicinamibacterales bacterium]
MWSIVGGETAARLMLAAVLAAPQAVLQELVPATLAQGTQSNIGQPRQVVVRTVEEWRVLWAAHSLQPAPPVDFLRSVVVGVFLGSRPTAGFRVEITGATAQDGQAVVRFVEHRPAPDAILAQIITTPFHLVVLPASLRAITLQQSESPR